MGKLTEITQWEEDIYQLETSDPVVGGPDGVSNKPQKQLANRTQWLKQQLASTNGALAKHAKSRNHPDASLTAKGFVQLYSGVMSDSEILAATPKAVKAAMDNANSRQPGNENLTALSSLAGQPDRLPYFTNKGAMTLAEFTAFMRTMLSKTDAASVLQYLGLTDTINRASHVQASDGNIYGSCWGGWLNDYIRRNTPSMPSLSPYATWDYVNQTFVRDIRMGSNESTVWGANGGTCPPGYVLTGGDFNDNVEYPIYAPVQKNINGTWYNVTRA
ncbi:TPA: tail fiber protein [Salmonella enterica subsp. enterica serovar Java]